MITEALIANGKSLTNDGFLNGRMGLALYFFYLSRYRNHPFFEEFASELLDDIVETIHLSVSVDFENGITGIGWAIEHLIQNGFIEGDADNILEEVDVAVFEGLFYNENNLETVLAIALYYISRLCYRIEDESNLVVLQLKQNTILLIDEIERLLNKGELRYELGTVLNELHRLRLYNFKVEKLQRMAGVPPLENYRFPYIPSYEDRINASSNKNQSIICNNYVPEEYRWGLAHGIAGIGLGAMLNTSHHPLSDHSRSISIIMSFYQRLDSFRVSLPRNIPYFAREGVELIICLDNPDEKDELCRFVAGYPELRCRIIMNPNTHQPRNHAAVLNVGIRAASQRNIMIIDPEIELQGDLIERYSRALEENPDHYMIGQLLYAEEDFDTDAADWSEVIPYGSLAVSRKYMHLIGGYDETFTQWGGEDDNLRIRLGKLGIKPILLNDAIFLHREIGCKEQCRIRQERSASILKEYGTKIFNPTAVRVNGNNWGRDFNETIYDNL